jgi:hypothetical protein
MINDLSKLIKNKYLYGSLIYSLEQFFINDDLLLSWKNDENSVYEVAISCKIWTYIYSALLDSWFFKDEQYKEFNIDMEYNKMWMKKIDKEIPWIWKLCGNSTNKIRPDIVIHKRLLWWSNNNLVIFEIKKKNLNSCDRKKLEELTKSSNEKFWYQYWIWLSNFNKKNESVDIDLCINWKFYEKGFIYKALEITYK